MKTDPAIVQFLCRPENVRLALQVSEAMDDAFTYLRREFEKEVCAGVQRRLNGNSFSGHFRFEPGEDIGKSNRYYGVWYIPEGISQEYYLHYSLVYAEEGDDEYLYYGLEWGSSDKAEPPGFAAKDVRCSIT